jgi:hypothetical protein
LLKTFKTDFTKRHESDFPKSEEFDVNYVDPKAKWVIPEEMKKGIIGFPVISIEDTTNFIGLITNVIWRELKRSFRRVKKRVKS